MGVHFFSVYSTANHQNCPPPRHIFTHVISHSHLPPPPNKTKKPLVPTYGGPAESPSRRDIFNSIFSKITCKKGPSPPQCGADVVFKWHLISQALKVKRPSARAHAWYDPGPRSCHMYACPNAYRSADQPALALLRGVCASESDLVARAGLLGPCSASVSCKRTGIATLRSQRPR